MRSFPSKRSRRDAPSCLIYLWRRRETRDWAPIVVRQPNVFGSNPVSIGRTRVSFESHENELTGLERLDESWQRVLMDKHVSLQIHCGDEAIPFDVVKPNHAPPMNRVVRVRLVLGFR